MTSKHTHGQWTARQTGWSKHPYSIHSSKRPGAVALIPSRTSVPLEEQDANARLIAEAPAMLEVIDSLVDWGEALTIVGTVTPAAWAMLAKRLENARAILARIDA